MLLLGVKLRWQPSEIAALTSKRRMKLSRYLMAQTQKNSAPIEDTNKRSKRVLFTPPK